jgi:Protein of unknown function (DUF3168)
MSIETSLYDTLKSLVNNRVYPDIAPEKTTLPYITYQQVGGDSINFLNQAIPSKHNARVQINVWACTRQAASQLALQVEQATRLSSALDTTVLGAFVSTYDEPSNLYGTRQDFSVWG